MSNPAFVPTLQVKDELNEVLGIAFFDRAGLPLQDFSTREHPNRMWVQVAFQSIGLYSMLPRLIEPLMGQASHFGGIQIVCSPERHLAIAISPRAEGYVAFLVAIEHNQKLDTFCYWSQNLDLTQIAQHPKFQPF